MGLECMGQGKELRRMKVEYLEFLSLPTTRALRQDEALTASY